MKWLVVVLVLVSSGCSSNGNSNIATDPLVEDIEWVTNCTSQTSSVGFWIVFEREFNAMQRAIRDGAAAAELPESRSHLLEAISDPEMSVRGLRVYEAQTDESLVPGVTSYLEFVNAVGLRRMAFFTGVAIEPIRDEAVELSVTFKGNPTLECYAQRPEAMDYLCEEQNQVAACVGVEMYPDRDLALIAEACEQVPYLDFCNPEDPIPWEPPETES